MVGRTEVCIVCQPFIIMKYSFSLLTTHKEDNEMGSFDVRSSGGAFADFEFGIYFSTRLYRVLIRNVCKMFSLFYYFTRNCTRFLLWKFNFRIKIIHRFIPGFNLIYICVPNFTKINPVFFALKHD